MEGFAGDSLANKEETLVKLLQGLESLVVAYSGGVDSALLAYYARKIVGDKARVVIAVSPSLAADDLDAAREQAQMFDWNLIEIATDEFENEEYLRNDGMRCFFCKATLFEKLDSYARTHSINAIAYGANVDDRTDYRPGKIAAEKFAVRAPLDEAEFTKEEIRTLARKAGLPSWDRPQNACLSSRIPTAIPVTFDKVARIDAAEQFIKSLGFTVVRVRHHDETAVVEVGQDEIERFNSAPNMVSAVKHELVQLGFREVVIDPRGYRRGAANEPALSNAAAKLVPAQHEG